MRSDHSKDAIKQRVKIVQEQLAPKPLITANRFRFHVKNQSEEESSSSFTTERRRVSEYCNFKDGRNETLRDMFVWGLLNESTQEELLTEEDLFFKWAFETAAKDKVKLYARATMEAGIYELLNMQKKSQDM